MKRLAVLGSTGSIGVSTLAVVDAFPDRFRVHTLAAGHNLEVLRRQIEHHRPVMVSIAEPGAADALRAEFPAIEFLHGARGLEEVACHPDVDMVVAGVVGAAGLAPTLAAIHAGKDVALANKETLVVAGDLVMAAAAAAGVHLLPVDSEHNAIHQALRVGPADAVSRLVLTASGGPFRTWTSAQIGAATVDDALAHPTWRMGPKISVDSATLMNKGLEIIEAHHLFGVAEDRIDVVVHPQSVVHSLVEYIDGTLIAQLSVNDMRCPILYALAWPDRLPSPVAGLDLVAAGRLDFSAPDQDRFPALGLARSALRAGGEMPAVLNAANEVAVEAFLAGRCSFNEITQIVDAAMESRIAHNRAVESLEQALTVDRESRAFAAAQIVKYQGRKSGSG